VNRRRRSAALLALHVAAGMVAVACSGSPKPTPAPVPPVVTTTTTPTTLVDYSSVTLAPISGSTTIPVPSLTPGGSTLNGTVVDDTGAAVPGASVDIQRIVDGAVVQGIVDTSANGTWVAEGIMGGLYRVRAWLAPSLAETAPQIVFLAAGATQTLNLTVNHFSGMTVTSSVAPDPPIIGDPANIVVLVTGATVGTDGIVRSAGQAGVQVELFGEGQWEVEGDTTAVTDSDGYVEWQATCEVLGDQQLSVLVNGTQATALNLGDCSPVPTTTTTSTTTTSTTLFGRSTTTRPRSG
jgi:Carboxypeptidase regulatory-like domain